MLKCSIYHNDSTNNPRCESYSIKDWKGTNKVYNQLDFNTLMSAQQKTLASAKQLRYFPIFTKLPIFKLLITTISSGTLPVVPLVPFMPVFIVWFRCVRMLHRNIQESHHSVKSRLSFGIQRKISTFLDFFRSLPCLRDFLNSSFSSSSEFTSSAMLWCRFRCFLSFSLSLRLSSLWS